MQSLLIKNGTIVTPTGILEQSDLLITENLITDFGNAIQDTEGARIIDATDCIVMPGIIDVHTDALDAEIIPRPGADIPIEVAFRELERKMSGCGFTTVYHSMHLGYKVAEYGSRSKYKRREVFETVNKAIKGDTLLNNKIHLRFELTGVDAYDECLEYLEKGYVDMLSVMDHTPGQGQFTKAHFIELSIKSGKTEEQAIEEYEERNSRAVIKDDALAYMIKTALSNNISVASHDDDSIERVITMHELGVNICEFPINMETAVYASNIGKHVVGGASNILRGGSLSGNLNIKDAVLAGAVDSLCSDYYPPSIIHAIFKLYQEYGMALHQAVNLATLNPAKATGIDTFTGSIDIGKDADIIIVKLIDNMPMVLHTIVKGRVVVSIPNNISYNEALTV
jgi:alpha-D-ribose 1-methylphosphonate 5-triphosphate diphosphatase